MEIKREKSFAMGVLGALGGSLLGAAAIILLAQAGVVAAISGFVLALCTLKGFELLGGKLEKNSLIVCVVIMAVVPYLAHHASYAIIFVQSWEGLQFGDACVHLFELIETVDTLNGNTEVMGAFIKDLLFVYAFTALGGFTIVKQAFAKKDAPAPVEVLEEDAVIATEEEDVVVEAAAPIEE